VAESAFWRHYCVVGEVCGFFKSRKVKGLVVFVVENVVESRVECWL
jgi:hypothetical protein